MTSKTKTHQPSNPKVAIVTGGSSGIGEATARQLKESGYEVYACARRVDRMASLEAAGIHVLKLDVTSEGSMKEAVATVLAAFPRIDVLINNAGYGSYGAVEDVPIVEARHQLEVNVLGLARMTQLVLPTMRQQGSGIIINISSIGGKFGEPLGAWYHASKYAVEGFSDSLAMELSPFGIRVVCVEPGNIKTEWGTIAMENLAKVSGGGPYDTLVKRRQSAMDKLGARGSGDAPEAVAVAISRIIENPKPKYRYAVAGGAPLILWLRRIMPERAFYAVMKRFLI